MLLLYFLQSLLWVEASYPNLGWTHLSKLWCGSQDSSETQDEIFSLDTMGIIRWLEKGKGAWVRITLGYRLKCDNPEKRVIFIPDMAE